MPATNPYEEGLDAQDNAKTPVSAKRLNEPFFLESVEYDSGADDINITVGHGRANFGKNTIVEKTSDTTATIASPSTNTTYYVYLQQDGTFLTSTDDERKEALLGKLDTPSDLSNTQNSDLTDLRSILSGPIAPFSGSFEAFTSDGTFNVPAGVSNVYISGVGGGGGGAGGDVGGGGGSAGEGIVNQRFDVSGDSSISITIGSGGSGGGVSSDGDSGGDTSFGSKLTLSGGDGTSAGAAGSGGGSSRDASGSTAGRKGEQGGDGDSTADSNGGGGGASIISDGGNENKSAPNFGGGGGGGADGKSGGDGGDGILIVKWN